LDRHQEERYLPVMGYAAGRHHGWAVRSIILVFLGLGAVPLGFVLLITGMTLLATVNQVAPLPEFVSVPLCANFLVAVPLVTVGLFAWTMFARRVPMVRNERICVLLAGIVPLLVLCIWPLGFVLRVLGVKL